VAAQVAQAAQRIEGDGGSVLLVDDYLEQELLTVARNDRGGLY